MNKRIIQLLAGIGLYLISTGISYAVFTNGDGISVPEEVASPLSNSSPTPKKQFKVDPSIPRDQVCPLTGAMYTKKEKDVWDTRRPLAVMVENSAEARPHSGISRADIVYETLAEGFITRFMSVFYCNTPFENISVAPVRSARTYFLDWASEYDALYTHVGGANRIGENATRTDPRADALGQIDRFGIKDLDQFGIGYPDCYRNPDRLDHPVVTEHTMVCFTDNLFKIAEKRGWTNVDAKGIAWDKNFTPWAFKDEAKEGDRGTGSIRLVFAQGYSQYDVEWVYDKETNTYKRKNGGQPHLDLEANEQISAKNVIVPFTKLIGPVDDNGHFLYTTIASGKALVFQDGKVIEGNWSKKSRIGRMTFTGTNGKEISLNRGPIWIEVIPSEEQITY